MILVSVIVTFFGCIVTVRLLSGKKEIVSTITTPVVQESDLQDMVFSAYSSASEAIVDISISKDLKFYVEDPSQMTAPGSIQTKEAILG